MSAIQFIQATPEQIQDYLRDVVTSVLDDFAKKLKPEKQPDDFMTRSEVANKFQVNLSTIHNWVKAGKLKQYGIGNRVYFLRSEVEQSPRLLNSQD